MNSRLWRYYYEDDVDRFRHLLETSGYNDGRQTTPRGGQAGSVGAVVGSPSGLATSPNLNTKNRKASGHVGGLGTPSSGGAVVGVTRADINWRDANGLTILHHAASSLSETAVVFATALVEHPLIDLYLQDLENGWTALHRAFYFGNITIARAILERDTGDALGRTTGHVQQTIGLVKVKDKEGNGPLDLYAATIKDRTLNPEVAGRHRSGSNAESEDEHAQGDSGDGENGRDYSFISYHSIGGDEVFTFGSNQNVSLGFGDEDDRQFPERITLRRPLHLLQRFYREQLEHHERTWAAHDSSYVTKAAMSQDTPIDRIPWPIRSRPLVIQDVHMSKLHTAVLTTDPEFNLYMCGHGPGGRLGTGNEQTRYNFVCIESGALSGKKVATVALGQNHSLAISDEGEIFSWGNNGFGQLGYTLPKAVGDEDPVNPTPRQIFGPLKREIIVGLAASRIHSVAHTASSLYTFGKNEGQLGIVDSDARSLETQVIPRKVAASLFTSAIHSVSAIEKATVCLLENHEVWVFANYGYAKVQFPLDGFTNYFLKESFLVTKYDTVVNQIVKITSGGDNICALSSSGEIYTVSISQRVDAQTASASTTNPAKIRSALSQPQRIWSPKKSNMLARDVGVDADGSIILATEEGSAWKRTRRTKLKDATASGVGDYKPKDYKFSRMPGLNRVTAVRASAYGAYAAVRQDCDVVKTEIVVDSATLTKDLLPLLSIRGLAKNQSGSDEVEDTAPRFWQGRLKHDEVQALRRNVLEVKDIEAELAEYLQHTGSGDDANFDALVTSTTSEISIPVHRFVLTGRSRILRRGFRDLRETSTFTIPDLAISELNADGLLVVNFQGIDTLTILNFVVYLYTDTVIDFWHHARKSTNMAFRYRQIRTELMKLASKLDLVDLEPAVRQMVEPKSCLSMDMELAFEDVAFFFDGDVNIQLADAQVKAHSVLLCQRCPFFEGLFAGRAGGRWVAGRDDEADAIDVDLKHIHASTFRLVLRHVYADTGEELFDDIVSKDMDDFLDAVMDVLGAANELMLDRLSQICQKTIGRFVTVPNICSLLNAIAPSSVHEFKDASLEYLCLSLEAMLQGGLLDELEEDLLAELDDVVRQTQLACLPLARSGRAEALLHERHPELAAMMDRDRQAKIDAVTIRSKHSNTDHWAPGSLEDDVSSSPSLRKTRRKSSNQRRLDVDRPVLKGKASVKDMMFEMDEEVGSLQPSPSIRPQPSPSLRPTSGRAYDSTAVGSALDVWYDSRGKQLDSPASGSNVTSPRLAPMTPTSPSIAARAGSASGKPWSLAPLPGAQTDMKDLLAQASSSRTSSLSQGLEASKTTTPSSLASLTPAGIRMSQKERKKQMQQLASQTAAAPVQSSSHSAPPANKPSSPWQTASAQKVPALKDVIDSQKHPSPSSTPKAAAARAPTAPQLTMRQTVANAKPASSQKPTIGPGGQSSMPQRSVSGPVTPKPTVPLTPEPAHPVPTPQQARSPPSAPSGPSASNSRPIPHSIRHQPRPVEPSLQLSMSDILSQQQAEKDIVKEAVAKRDLQDIQAEQEFQEWWDKESARVRDEEMRRNTVGRAPRRGKARGGRGGRG